MHVNAGIDPICQRIGLDGRISSTIITLGAWNFNDISIHENDRRFADLHAIQFDPVR